MNNWTFDNIKSARDRVCRTKDYIYFFLRCYQEEALYSLSPEWQTYPKLFPTLPTEKMIQKLNEYDIEVVSHDETWQAIARFCEIYSREWEPIEFRRCPGTKNWGFYWGTQKRWSESDDINFGFQLIAMLIQYRGNLDPKPLGEFDAQVLASCLHGELIDATTERIKINIASRCDVELQQKGNAVKVCWQFLPTGKYGWLLDKAKAPLTGEFEVALNYGVSPHLWGRDDRELGQIIKQVLWLKWSEVDNSIPRHLYSRQFD